MTSSFSKSPENGVFKIFHSGERFPKGCVFGHCFLRIGMDGRPICNEKLVFSKETDNCGLGLNLVVS